MKRRKTDPVSLLLSLKQKTAAPKPTPLASIPPEEAAAFQALRQVLSRSKLVAYLDKKAPTEHGERALCINEILLAELYPGLNPLTDPLPGIDAFIYVYEGMSSHGASTGRARGDLRQYLGEEGFRQLLLELIRACQIHQFCADHLTPHTIVTEPITRKPTADARKEALAIHARAREVFHRIGDRIGAEIDGGDPDLPRVLTDACRFAREMTATLEPLALAGRRIRESTACDTK